MSTGPAYSGWLRSPLVVPPKMLKCEPEKARRRLADTVELRRTLSEENATVRAAQKEAQPESHNEAREKVYFWLGYLWQATLVGILGSAETITTKKRDERAIGWSDYGNFGDLNDSALSNMRTQDVVPRTLRSRFRSRTSTSFLALSSTRASAHPNLRFMFLLLAVPDHRCLATIQVTAARLALSWPLLRQGMRM